MRQYGLDLARARPTWRRWRFRRSRFGDICDLLQKFYPEFIFPEFGCDPFPPEFELGLPPEFITFPRGGRERFEFLLLEATGGVGCPTILIQQGFIPQDGLAQVQLAQAGVPIPTNERQNRFGVAGEFFFQLKKNPFDGVSARRCQFGFSEEQARELATMLDGFTPFDLSELGYI